jgi:hypothetical protein
MIQLEEVIHWVIVAIVTLNLALLFLIAFLAHTSVQRHAKNANLLRDSISRLTRHEEEEARNWIAFTSGISDTFQQIVKWQKMTARMMYRDAQALGTHDENVAELLVKANEISDQLKIIVARSQAMKPEPLDVNYDSSG